MATAALAGAVAVFALGSQGVLRANAQTPTVLVPGAYSGDAYAIGLTNMGGSLGTAIGNHKIIEAGPLPPAGGTLTNNVLAATVPPNGQTLVSAEVINEMVSGVNGTSTASSSVAAAAVLPGAVPPGTGGCPAPPQNASPCTLLGATLLTANTQVNCSGQTTPFVVANAVPPPEPPNSSGVATLSILGAPVQIPTAPNQVISLGPLGTVTLNEQSYDPATNTASASSIHIHLPVTSPLAQLISGDIIISHAESDLNGCVNVTPPPPGGSTSVAGVAALPNTGSGPGIGLGAGVSILLLLAAPPAVIGARIARRRVKRGDRS